MDNRTKQKPFLFIQCRPSGAIAEDERQTIAQLGGLRLGQSLRSIMLLEEPNLDPVRDLDLAHDYAGIIISGSPFGARPPAETMPDPVERETRQLLHARITRLAAEILDRDLPCLGLCYGLQLLGLAAGVPLTDRYPEDLQAVQIKLTEAGRIDPVTGHLPQVLTAYVGHSDALSAVPPSAVLLGEGSFCLPQLLRFGDNVYGTQFHPEITTAGMKIRIDTYGDTYYAAAEKRLVEERCLTRDVTSGNQLVSAFVKHYQR